MKKLLSIMIMLLVVVSVSVPAKAEVKLLKKSGSWYSAVEVKNDPIYGTVKTFIINGNSKNEEGIFELDFVIVTTDTEYVSQMDVTLPKDYLYSKNEVTFKVDSGVPTTIYMVLYPENSESNVRSIRGEVVNQMVEKMVEHKTLLIDTLISDYNLNRNRKIINFDLNGFTECAMAVDKFMNGY